MNDLQKIGLGSVQFGIHYGISNKIGKTPPEEVKKILQVALKHGIRMLDTAIAYGNAEKVLGQNDLNNFNVVSKFLPPDNNEPLRFQLQKSLADLNLHRIYGYLAHRPVHLCNHMFHWVELKELKEKGIISKIGFSLNRPEELKLLLDAGAIPDLVQLPYNYFDRRFESSISLLKKKGCEIHARSVFLQGLFFKKSSELSLFFNEVKPVIEQLNQEVQNLAASLLSFVIRHPQIDRVIIGVENRYQLLENLSSLQQAETLPKLTKQISENILVPSNWPK